ncbi:hypothetical protein RI367_004372 [Sorochytrium milnesiophthora]
MPPVNLARASRWRRLPREVQLIVYALTDVATAARCGDIFAMRWLIRRDLPVASVDVMRSWWVAVLETGWLDGAQVLVDAGVMYLPRLADFDDESIAAVRFRTAAGRWPHNVPIIDFLLPKIGLRAYDFTGMRAPVRYDKLTWTDQNLLAVFALIRRLPANAPQRLSMLWEVWQGVPGTFRRYFLHILVAYGDTCTMKELRINAECFTHPADALAPDARGQRYSAAVLTYLRDNSRQPLPFDKLILSAIKVRNLAAFAWLYDQLTAEQIDSLDLIRHAITHVNVDILQWLHHHVGISCSHKCAAVDDIPLACRLYMPGNVGVSTTCDLKVLQWFSKHHPHTIGASVFDYVCTYGEYDTALWLQNHHPEFRCTPQILLNALRAGRYEMVPLLQQHHPHVLTAVRAAKCDAYIWEAFNHNYIVVLNWFLYNHPRAFDFFLDDRTEGFWAPHAWLWMLDHSQFAPWHRLFQLPGEYIDRRILDMEEHPENMPPAPHSLYVRLGACHQRMPHSRDYFAVSAIAAGDERWLLQVARDYKTTLGRLCDADDLYKERQLPLLRRLITAHGLPAHPGMLTKCIKQANHRGIAWLLLHAKVAPNNAMAKSCAAKGYMHALQLIHARGVACRDCVMLSAELTHRPHITAWARAQPDRTWSLCQNHD